VNNLELVRTVWDEFMRMNVPIELFHEEAMKAADHQ
jgi:hypothetical protein